MGFCKAVVMRVWSLLAFYKEDDEAATLDVTGFTEILWTSQRSRVEELGF